jgi:phosphotransferase system enzyme I (PtsI)
MHSHAALMARAKGIPYVASIDIVEGTSIRSVIVDGQRGEVILNPTPSTLELYTERESSWRRVQQEPDRGAQTLDGCEVSLHVNVGHIEELEVAKPYHPKGIGLFRSEYLFLERKHLIFSEEEQYVAYVELLDAMKGFPVVIRAFDMGGDKTLPEFTEKEENPLMGCRGIRFLLAHQELFTLQLRALLRAALHGDLRLLLPLVADVGELIRSKQLLQEAAQALRKEGIPCKESLSVGCMIEVPSAVMSCDILLKRCDFLSMGTNDLVQYTFGIDRNHPAMGELCYPAHPSLLRMLKMVVNEAKQQGKPVTLCGEIASNPLFIPLLLGLGIDHLSCAPRSFPEVKHTIRKTTLSSAKLLAEQVLQLDSIDEVMSALVAYRYTRYG